MNIYQNGILYLYGSVGDYSDEENFTARQVIDALAVHGKTRPITVHINSGGGYATEGAAIYTALAAHQGRVSVSVDSIAASAASLIAMAGDEITMRLGSVMMIHDPSGATYGTAADHRKTTEGLEAMADSYAAIYAARTGRTKQAMRAVMREETWYGADEAIAAGLAHKTDTAQAVMAARFAYAKYSHAPRPLTDGTYRMGIAPDARAPARLSMADNMRQLHGMPLSAQGQAVMARRDEGLRIDIVANMRKLIASRSNNR